jgi:hypothetical protein
MACRGNQNKLIQAINECRVKLENQMLNNNMKVDQELIQISQELDKLISIYHGQEQV